MNINIYYGGRGLIEDPTLYVIEKMEGVLNELNVTVTRYNLFEMKSSITTLPQTLKEADGLILAVNVEWLGIGGYMQEFLDACWLYGDKEKIKSIYMEPVVVATTYGEQDALNHLKNSWEIIGGNACAGISTYVEDTLVFEMNEHYLNIIEKEAETLYRNISQKRMLLPTSNYAIKKNAIKESVHFTAQESEQLSKYVADDTYVKKQKEDIEELASMFKGMLDKKNSGEEKEFVEEFRNCFSPQKEFYAEYQIEIEDKEKYIYIKVDNENLTCKYEKKNAAIIMRLNYKTINEIVHGEQTFQKAFMCGEMKAKGNFSAIRMLDQLFVFK